MKRGYDGTMLELIGRHISCGGNSKKTETQTFWSNDSRNKGGPDRSQRSKSRVAVGEADRVGECSACASAGDKVIFTERIVSRRRIPSDLRRDEKLCSCRSNTLRHALISFGCESPYVEHGCE